MNELQKEEITKALHDCMEACNYCYDACLEEDDVKMMSACIRLDRECADICGYTEQAIARDSAFVDEFLKVCALICRACEDECRQHDHDHCQHCADMCKRCADICEEFTA